MDGVDELWPQGPRLCREAGFKLCTDSVLLADFINMKKVVKAADLGCGAGILAVLSAFRNKNTNFDCIEIAEENVRDCLSNIRINGLEDRMSVTAGDLREIKKYFSAGAYDLVMSNPPYNPQGCGKEARGENRAASRDERFCTIFDLSAAAAYLCRYGAGFCMVHKPQRLSEIFGALTTHGFEPKRLRLVCPRPGAEANLALIDARRGGKPGLRIEAPLFLYGADGAETEEYKNILSGGGAI
ncbi:MAG: methyltransferase [Oscillospiraceae bacterium]|nr:methyltransferase [Oscillospiraceae bacterium]